MDLTDPTVFAMKSSMRRTTDDANNTGEVRGDGADGIAC